MKKLALAFLSVTVFSMVGIGQAAAPTLTKTEQLELENLQLKQALVNEAINAFQAKYKEVNDEIEKAHPGFTLQGNGNSFVLVAKAPPAPPPSKTDKENQKEVQQSPKPKGP